MKRASFLLIITFANFIIGQIVWSLSFYCGSDIFGGDRFTEMLLIQIFNGTGILGFISAIMLYKSVNE